MYELVFFLPLFKVYGTCLDNLRLSSNYLGGEMLQTAGVAYSSVNSQTHIDGERYISPKIQRKVAMHHLINSSMCMENNFICALKYYYLKNMKS